MPANNVNATIIHNNSGYCANENFNSLPASSLNQGNTNFASNTPSNADMIASITDSDKNWKTNCFFSPPITFRKPTSFALLAERPIDNVVKLIQAISSTPAAIPINIQIVFG